MLFVRPPIGASLLLLFLSAHLSQVVILPGALVPPLAYAPLARTMAQKGHPSYVVRFDFDLGKPTLRHRRFVFCRRKMRDVSYSSQT